ncbi:MAG: HAD family hydrolase [Thermoplasmatota archaeon]
MKLWLNFKNVENDTMEWLIFDVDGVLIDVSESFDIAVKKTVETILKKFDERIELELGQIRDLRKKGLFSNDFELSEALILGKMEYEKIDDFVKEFPERETREWIKSVTNVYIGDETVKKIFNSYYFAEEYEYHLFDTKAIYKREKRIIDLDLIKKSEERFKIGIITGRDRKEMKLAEDIIGYKFNNVITRDEVEKPNPNCLKQLLGSEEGIYIGDTETDRIMVERFNEIYKNHVEFYKVSEDRNVNGVLKKIMKEMVSGKA